MFSWVPGVFLEGLCSWSDEHSAFSTQPMARREGSFCVAQDGRVQLWCVGTLMRALRLLGKSAMTVVVAALFLCGICMGQTEPYCPMLPYSPGAPGHPHPQPRPAASQVRLTQENGMTVAHIDTGFGCFTESDPFQNPPGTNFLPDIWTNAFDGTGAEMPNTLPSTPTVPYNLHDGQPVVSKINPASPTDDLQEIFDHVEFRTNKAKTGPLNDFDIQAMANNLQRGVDILEGNPVPDRLYSGLPLLHYKGPEKVRAVTPIKDQNGKVIGGNIDIHQVWYDTHIESDVSLLDPSAVENVPWTITYTVDVLSRGNDDFSPFVMYVDNPEITKPKGMPPLPHVGMDQTFYNMEEGTRTVFKIKMAPGKYYNLSYTWGWRAHPPRVQVSENATKRLPVIPPGAGKTLVQEEVDVFGEHPSEHKEQAIAKIGDLSPAKRMWKTLRAGQDALKRKDYKAVAASIWDAREAFFDWRDRAKLPRGVKVDRNADLTLFYVNNTIYGEFRDGTRVDWPKWTLRGTTLQVRLINGDYFEHGYQNVDFGGSRGWENQFQSSVESGGSGPWFTFGRVHWWMNVPAIVPDEKNPGSVKPFGIVVPAATQDSLGNYKVEITYQYEPSRRLRFYQFDPMHHDVAVFSVH